jgi:hypothetical protein
MKAKIAVSTTIVTLLSMVSIGDTVVYQDTFDGDGISTNTGVGGGLDHKVFTSYTLDATDNSDNLVFNSGLGSNLGAQHGGVASIQKFAVTEGFTLDVIYTVAGIPGSLAESVGIGLIDGVDDLSGMLYSPTKHETLGISLTTRNGNQGLNHCTYTDGDADGALTSLSNAQTISAGTDRTFSLTVDADGNFSFSVDGATATTGTTTFDLTKDYHFAIYSQRPTTGLEIQSATLTAIPEPASIGLFATFGGAVLFVRRRFSR